MSNLDRNTKALILFFVLALLLHIAAGLICRAVPVFYLQILLPWTPNISAILVVVFYLKEESGVRRLASGWKRWRARARISACSPRAPMGNKNLSEPSNIKKISRHRFAWSE